MFSATSTRSDAAAVKARWDAIKAEEKAERAARRGVGRSSPASPKSILDDVPVALPALTRAVKLQKRAGKVGFDWNDPHAVIAKIREEISEIEHELSQPTHDQDRLEDELGDILFAVANLARHLSVDPEAALRRTNAKFIRRFATSRPSFSAAAKSSARRRSTRWKRLWVEAKEREQG